jgi:1-acyl-sn-glycerol-3-phosphate acyltransferase
MQYIRSKTFDLFLLLWTIGLGSAIPLLWLLQKPELVRLGSRIWSSGIIFGLKYIVGLTYKEIGIENKLSETAIFACNHQSIWETLVFNVLLPDVAIVLKKSLYSVPIVGWYLRNSPMIAVDRNAGASAMKALLKGAKGATQSGRQVLVFPEGTRVNVDAKVVLKPGIALLYRSLSVPVVPVAVNAGAFWNDDGAMKYNGEITVSYLPAILPGLSEADFMGKLQESLNSEKERLLRDLNVDEWLGALG